MTLNPFTLYNKAARAVPSIKYALGVAGMVAAGAMALAVSKGNPKVATLSFVAVLIGMCLLVVFAAAANAVGRWPGIILVWAVTILFVCMLIVTVTALAFGLPGNWAKVIGVVGDNPTKSASGVKKKGGADEVAGDDGAKATPATQPSTFPVLTSQSAAASTSGNCAPAFAGVSVGGSMSNTFNCPSSAAATLNATASAESEVKK